MINRQTLTHINIHTSSTWALRTGMPDVSVMGERGREGGREGGRGGREGRRERREGGREGERLKVCLCDSAMGWSI